MAISRVPDGPRVPTSVGNAPDVSATEANAKDVGATEVDATPRGATSASALARATDQVQTGGAPLVSAPTVALNPTADTGREALREALAEFKALAADIPSELPAGRKVAGFLELNMPHLQRPLSVEERASAQALAANLLGTSE